MKETIMYVGECGRECKAGKFIGGSFSHDQEKRCGKLSLVSSYQLKQLVRVIRGCGAEYGPGEGYRYDGLYYVDNHEYVEEDHGFKVFNFYMSEERFESKPLESKLPIVKVSLSETGDSDENPNLMIDRKLSKALNHWCTERRLNQSTTNTPTITGPEC
ncbi:hypothetical protein HK098_005376 [Nowakowskiella sp. JEL0407]|nr:hypothetical protein HK098_005376 [Nowakowskiella sp. JEL0407]